jgi:NodT family efflux transporter outer membrane factor (OMF) lipoprotein
LGPDFVPPKAPADSHYNHGQDSVDTVSVEGISQRFEAGVAPVANWWKLYHSDELDAVVAEGLANNPTLQAAQASLRQSNDNLQAGYGIFYPQVSADAGAERQKFSPARFGSSASGSIFNLVTLSASVSYALDVFGGEHRLIENLQSQADEQRAIVQGTYLSLTGNIVNTTIAMAAYHDEIIATEQLIAMLKEEVSITDSQVKAGTISYQSVLALQSQLASLEATLPPLQQKLSQSEHLLATLVGHAPSEWQSPEVSLDKLTLPDKLPLSLPSELVRQRPDIVAAEASLHGASANIGVATAAQFPSFTLNATFGQNSTSMNGLMGSNSNFWGIGPDITAPLFNGGTLAARKQGAIDAYQQSQALYRQTVINAFSQVADTLKALEHDAQTQLSAFKAAQFSEELLHLVQVNNQAGTVNYLQVLSANIQYHQAKIAYLQAQAQRLQDTTALFVALGGGWKSATYVPSNAPSDVH